METLIKELNDYVQSLDKDLKIENWNESISLSYKDCPMIYVDLIEEKFSVCGEILESAFEENDLNNQIALAKHFKYIGPFIDKFIKLFNSKDKYVYQYPLMDFNYYLYYGDCYENEFPESCYGITALFKVRFFENDDRLECVNFDNLTKIKDNSPFGDNQGEWMDLELSDTEKNLLEKLLIKK